jgi:hypothetical protein
MRHLVLLLPWAFACAAAPPQKAASPATPATAPSAETTTAKPNPTGRRAIAPAAVPPPPAECQALAAHPTKGCIPAGKARDLLAAAIAPSQSPLERDAALACLEESGDFAAGLVRALRAELAPTVCADAIAAPFVERPPQKLALDIEGALLGLVVSGRLERLLGRPPELTSPFSKERFLAFQKDELGPWIVSQALAIDQLSTQGARLTGYGRGIAAIASGNADLRFVETAREIPLPEEIRSDKVLTDVYYGALDEALEPRKRRGRDAALAGLRVFAELGVLADARVERARALLSKLWAGSRVDALDEIILPPYPPNNLTSVEGNLAGMLPTFYASHVLLGIDLSSPELIRAFSAPGLPKAMRDSLDAKKLSSPARLLLATALVESGRRYFHAADFRRAKEVLLQGKLDESGQFLVALAAALERGPEDTAELMLKGPGVKGSFDVSALDAVAKKNGAQAGAAAFDAAIVLGLVPKPDDPAFWEDLGARFESAEELLEKKKAPVAERERAEKYAEGARATARALREKR